MFGDVTKGYFGDLWIVPVQGFLTIGNDELTERNLMEAATHTDAGTTLGKIIAEEYRPSKFVEMACGLAIPSAVLSNEGVPGRAFDHNPLITSVAKNVRDVLGLDFEIYDFDFYNLEPLPRDCFIIAEKPRGKRNFEKDIIEYAINGGNGVALVPVDISGQSDQMYQDRCDLHQSTLEAAGYRVKQYPTCEVTGLTAVIGVKE